MWPESVSRRARNSSPLRTKESDRRWRRPSLRRASDTAGGASGAGADFLETEGRAGGADFLGAGLGDGFGVGLWAGFGAGFFEDFEGGERAALCGRAFDFEVRDEAMNRRLGAGGPSPPIYRYGKPPGRPPSGAAPRARLYAVARSGLLA